MKTSTTIDQSKERLRALEDVKYELELSLGYWKKPMKGVSNYSRARYNALRNLIKNLDDLIEEQEHVIAVLDRNHEEDTSTQRKPRIKYTNYFGLGDGPRTEITR